MQYAPLPEFLDHPVMAEAAVVMHSPLNDEPPAGCWLESGIDLRAGLVVEEDSLDPALFDLFVYAASLPQSLH